MPPFIPIKRSLSPPIQPSPPLKRPATEQHVLELLRSSESSLSDVSSNDDDDDYEEDWQDVKQPSSGKSQAKNRIAGKDDADDDDESVDWEDAMGTTTSGYASYTTPAQDLGIQDLELTLDGIGTAPTTSLLDTKKGPSQIERSIRINTHKAHVQCLLFHNAIRNSWLNDKKVHDILREQLPAGIQKEIQRWRIASALDPPPPPPPSKDDDATKAGKKKGSKKKKKKKTEMTRDWGGEAKRLEPGQPDMSHGDPILQLLRVLAAYWKRNFKVTAPGLRKHGYRSAVSLEALVASFKKGEHNILLHGERIADRHEFRVLAAQRQGSRDVGAQLFTALLRSLGIEARLVSNLQPLGFGWTKAETDTSVNVQSEATGNLPVSAISDTETESDDEGSSTEGKGPKVSQFDRDLSFPIYWAEVVSPITHEIIPVDPLILSNSVAATPEMVAAFEPRGSRADKAKQVIAYVVAHSPDGTAKDVTTRYLKRQTWPGKTKGYRLPVEKMTLRISKRGPTYVIDHNWFNKTMRGYVRADKERKMVDDIEDAKDLVANQPEKKTIKKETDTLQSLKASTEFVLERFLRREEALRPGAKVVRKFVTGKGDKAKEENVYCRAEVLRCLSAESWHKEGRRPKMGEAPLKRVPIRAVTLMRKREVEELARQTGEKPLQGLYARYQTEFIIPPPIQNGVIPKNEYGNIDCFVPTMVPRGATHIPWGGTVRICKKLGIDYAEAVTGFEFGSKMAVPVIEGVVVADENADMVRDAWQADQEVRREKERLAHEKRILQTWRKFIMGLRIMERVRVEYGDDGDAELDNPFQRPQRRVVQSVDAPGQSVTQEASGEDHNENHNYEDDHHHEENDIDADLGGGFLLPGHDDEEMNDLVVDHVDKIHRETSRTMHDEDEDDPNPGDESETGVADFELASSPSEEEYKPLARGSNRRRRRGR